MTSLEDFYGPVIHTYTRADAIADGSLVDVTPESREAGFKVPVALTAAVHEDCVAWENTDAEQAAQDEAGRLWDVLFLAHLAARRNRDGEVVRFKVARIARGELLPTDVELVCHIGPGDNAEPVITIMQDGDL